jgi:hypothetical protein
MRRLIRRHATAAAAAAASLAFAGIAAAHWSGTGSGSATGTTQTPLAITLSPAAPASTLYPGGTAAVALTATNPNDFAIRIGALSLDTTQGAGGFAVDGGHAACDLGALSFTTQTNGGSGWTVPAKVGGVNGSLAVTLAGSLAMSPTAANACQGASFTVYLVAGA